MVSTTPDLNPNDPTAEEHFKEVQAAYDAITKGETGPQSGGYGSPYGQQGYGGTKRGAAVDTKQRGVGQRIGKEGLHHKSAHRQGGTCQYGGEHLRHTRFEHDVAHSLIASATKRLPHLHGCQTHTAGKQGEEG